MADDEGPITFILSAEASAYYRRKRAEHNKHCKTPEVSSDGASKYHFKVREVAGAWTFIMCCLCGAKFDSALADQDRA